MWLQVTEHALAGGDEITAVLAFETFLDLLEVPASWMSAFLPALVKLSVESACNTQLELNTREQALQVPAMPTAPYLPAGLACLGMADILQSLAWQTSCNLWRRRHLARLAWQTIFGMADTYGMLGMLDTFRRSRQQQCILSHASVRQCVHQHVTVL